MIETLAGLDAIRLAQIGVKAASYVAVLLAAGSALFLAVHRDVGGETARFTRRLAAGSALAGLALCAATLAGEALFLAGGDLAAATDPFLIGVVLESPIADAQGLRALGHALVATLALGAGATRVAAAGAVALAGSFAMAGHSLGEPRLALAALVVVHVLAVAYWLGAFAPLARLARRAPPVEAGRVAEAFGRNAVVAVGLLIVAGLASIALLAPDPAALPATPYGRFLGLKLGLVAALLGLGALNKLSLSPALAAGEAGAGAALVRSIAAEAALAALILAVTAAMTLLGSP
jgi:putative copper resistance protein D